MSQDAKRTTTRRAVLSSTALAVAAIPLAGGSPLAAVTPDPIFEVIAQHREAVEEFGRLCLAECEMTDFGPDKDPRYDAAKGATGEARKRMFDALHELLTEQPTTLLGLAALLEYVAQPDHGHDPKDSILLGAAGWADVRTNVWEAFSAFPSVLAETIRSLGGARS